MRGRVAQIDHLLINRALDCFVFESKHFHAGLKITEDGEFLRWNDFKKNYEGMPSPLAQNDRHIAVLKDVFERIEMPTRLGVRLMPSFYSYVLVSANARIDRPKDFDTSRIVKVDVVKEALDKQFNNEGFLTTVSSLAKSVDTDTLRRIGRRLLKLHKPLEAESAAELSVPAEPMDGLAAVPVPQAPAVQAHGYGPTCKHCGGRAGSILYGKYGYYLKCAGCDGNTSIRVECEIAGHQARVRKEGRAFFRECGACGSSSVYFTNPE